MPGWDTAGSCSELERLSIGSSSHPGTGKWYSTMTILHRGWSTVGSANRAADPDPPLPGASTSPAGTALVAARATHHCSQQLGPTWLLPLHSGRHDTDAPLVTSETLYIFLGTRTYNLHVLVNPHKLLLFIVVCTSSYQTPFITTAFRMSSIESIEKPILVPHSFSHSLEHKSDTLKNRHCQ